MTTERDAVFRACPVLRDYLATMLQDLQYSESDKACTEEREERDSGTIYTCPADTFNGAREYCERFMRENANDILSAQTYDDTTEETLYLSDERIGSTLYLASVGHGVTFTDDGDAECLQRLADWARDNRGPEPYFGDDCNVYLA